MGTSEVRNVRINLLFPRGGEGGGVSVVAEYRELHFCIMYQKLYWIVRGKFVPIATIDMESFAARYFARNFPRPSNERRIRAETWNINNIYNATLRHREEKLLLVLLLSFNFWLIFNCSTITRAYKEESGVFDKFSVDVYSAVNSIWSVALKNKKYMIKEIFSTVARVTAEISGQASRLLQNEKKKKETEKN